METFTDITQRKLAEDRLTFANALLEAQMAAFPDGILVVDADRKIKSCNQRFAEICRMPPALLAERDARGTLASSLAAMKDPGTFSARVEDLYDHPDQSSHDELEMIDGRFVDCRSVRLGTQAGENIGRIWFFRDTTAERQAAEVLRAARDAADRSARAKSEFLAMMSHEIRSPMSGLLGIIELLRETPLAGDQRHMVGLVQGSAASLLQIVNDILDFSKMEAGSLGLSQEPADPREVVAGVVAPSAHSAAGRGLLFSSEVAADVPACVMLDALGGCGADTWSIC